MSSLILFVSIAILVTALIAFTVLNPVFFFKNKIVRERYPDLVAELGSPDFISNRAGGLAVWTNAGVFSKVVLSDESYTHLVPKPHCDFLYGSVRVNIPDAVLPKVLFLSESISYDRLTKTLTARCHFLGAIVATLTLALKIVHDPTGVNSYYSQYGPLIMSTMDNATYMKLKTELLTSVLAEKASVDPTIDVPCTA